MGLADSVPCEELTRKLGDPTKPIVVFVPGIGGDGEEMRASLPVLMESKPASVFMFRWIPFERRELIVTRLAKGVSRLAECLPGAPGRLLVIAHSAGGVIASFAVGRMTAPGPVGEARWLTVLTVAAPLAGKGRRDARPDGNGEAIFFLDLGTRILSYPAPTHGIQVVHLRTFAPADSVMEADQDLIPNDPKIGVPGAPQVDLPRGLSHPEALKYVAGEVAAGRWTAWRDVDASAATAP